MNFLESVRRRVHPLHVLRRSRLFQGIPRHFDPIIRWRLRELAKPIHLRLLSHASIIGQTQQEQSVSRTFVEILAALPGDRATVFWDVGANIGCYTWLCASIRPDLGIVSFEPDLKNLECLRRTSRAWSLPNHQIVPKAVSETTGRSLFHPDDVTGATGALHGDGETFNEIHYHVGVRTVEVSTVSLDDFAREHQAPSVIKIDIEGFELAALKGGSNLLNSSHPVLFLETYSKREQIFSFLNSLDYRVFDSDRRQNAGPETTNIVAVPVRACAPVITALTNLGYPIK